MTQGTTQSADDQTDKSAPVSEETKAIVEKNLPDESDEVKQKFGELIDAIKRQAVSEMESVEDISRETYIQALEKAQRTLKRAQGFLQTQEETLQTNVNQVKDKASHRWENLLADVKSMGNRVDRAINAAWTILTESEKDAS
jgi:L-lactate utilization protein LutC